MILSVQYIEDPTGYGTGIQKILCSIHSRCKKILADAGGDLQVTPAVVNLYEEVDGQTVKKIRLGRLFV
mgnify:CR=1 FL=1